jgi:hypothetical protein
MCVGASEKTKTFPLLLIPSQFYTGAATAQISLSRQMRITLRLLCLIPCLFSATNASAQNPYNMMNLIGGLVQSAIMQATLAEWQKIPPAERSCIDEALHERGVSFQSLVQQGIAPFDARLAILGFLVCLP